MLKMKDKTDFFAEHNMCRIFLPKIIESELFFYFPEKHKI
jgi:hypothetical protein